MEATNSEADPALKHFRLDHLPPHLQAVSQPFCDLAHKIVKMCPPDPQRAIALQFLLQSKDAAVRAALVK